MEERNADQRTQTLRRRMQLWMLQGMLACIALMGFMLWISESAPRVLAFFDDGRWTTLGSLDERVHNLLVLPDGTAWAESGDAVYRFGDGRWDRQTPGGVLRAAHRHRWHALQLGGGAAWSLSVAGISRWEDGEWRKSLDLALDRPPVAAGGDAQGVWLVSADGRYLQYRQAHWTETRLGERSPAPTLSQRRGALARTGDGALWLVSADGQLWRFDGAGWGRPLGNHSLGESRLVGAAGERLWLIRDEQLVAIEPDTDGAETWYPAAQLDLSGTASIRAVLARGPAILLDTGEGPRVLHDGAWQVPPGLDGHRIEALALGPNGAPWVLARGEQPLRDAIHDKKWTMILMLPLALYGMFAFNRGAKLLLASRGKEGGVLMASGDKAVGKPQSTPARASAAEPEATGDGHRKTEPKQAGPVCVEWLLAVAALVLAYLAYKLLVEPGLQNRWPDMPALDSLVTFLLFVIICIRVRKRIRYWPVPAADRRESGKQPCIDIEWILGTGFLFFFLAFVDTMRWFGFDISMGEIFFVMLVVLPLAFFVSFAAVIFVFERRFRQAFLGGDYAAALRVLGVTDASGPGPIRSDSKVVSFVLDNDDICRLGGEVQIAMGDYAGAESTLRSYPAKTGMMSAGFNARTATLLARALFEQGRYDEAPARSPWSTSSRHDASTPPPSCDVSGTAGTGGPDWPPCTPGPWPPPATGRRPRRPAARPGGGCRNAIARSSQRPASTWARRIARWESGSAASTT